MTPAEYYRKVYRHDPAYRAMRAKIAKEFRERHRNDPVWVRMTYLEKRVCSVRKSMEIHQTRAAECEKQLLAYTRELLRLRAKRKETRHK